MDVPELSFLKCNIGKYVVVCTGCRDALVKETGIKNMYIESSMDIRVCKRCNYEGDERAFHRMRLRKPILRILRGIPGAGKTTIVEQLLIPDGWKAVSADSYFIDQDTGEYNFVPSEIQDAHDVCFRNAVKLLAEGYDVVVDNTNRTLSDFSRYVNIKGIEFTLQVRRVLGDYGSKKNVPDHIMDRHRKGYEPYKGEITVRSFFDSTGKLHVQELRSKK